MIVEAVVIGSYALEITLLYLTSISEHVNFNTLSLYSFLITNPLATSPKSEPYPAFNITLSFNDTLFAVVLVKLFNSIVNSDGLSSLSL